MSKRLLLLSVVLLIWLSGCAVNPVTGKNEFAMVSESSEIDIGNKQYLPARQMQGGDYSTHPQIVAYVKQVGQKLAAVSDRNLPYEFNVINDSTPNAWALPGGKIVINRGLLVELKSEAELAAVLGHEIVHAAARHGAKGMERGILLQGVVLAAGVASQNSEYGQLAVGAAGAASQLITQKYSRSAELEADLYGMKYMSKAGYDSAAAIDLQQTFVRLSAGHKAGWIDGLFASHPPSPERVATNKETAATLKAGGKIGRQEYQQMIAPLLRDAAAYKAFDAGRKALHEGASDKALNFANQALKLQPKEALFHSLRGDVRLKQKRYRDAIINYDRAVDHDSEYFHFYLQRGLAKLELGETSQGESDLNQSVKLLPTAPAMNALGNLALNSGDRETAKKYFATAAGSNSIAGKAANTSLVKLDLPDNPGKYLQLRFGLDKDKYLIAQVTNRTSVPVTQIGYLVQFTDIKGNIEQVQLQLAGTLASKQAQTVSTGIGPLADLKTVQGEVVSGQVVD